MNYQINNKNDLEEFIAKNYHLLNTHIDQLATTLPIPIYSSVDIREGALKYAPIDHNLFPAGFNNLCYQDLEESGIQFLKAINQISASIKSVAIIPESHTKNLFYLDHLAYLSKLITDQDLEVNFISLDQNLLTGDQNKIELTSAEGHSITIIRARVLNDKIVYADNVTADLILLNNDQSSPIDISWEKIKTPVIPSPLLGWHLRHKIEYFECYKKIADEFCEKYSINPNLIQAQFTKLCNIDFSNATGLSELATSVDKLKQDLPAASKVFIKASQGTYGMGISVVSSGEEVLKMNRKARKKMDVGKNNKKFTSSLIQEGVDTVLKIDDVPGEITIYLINGISTGGFIRGNKLKDATANLNSKGMFFKKLCISDLKQKNLYKAKEATYSIIARLATLAAGLEIQISQEKI